VAGLISAGTAAQAARDHEKLDHAAQTLGCRMASPFMALSFLALPVIPHLRLTDRGLVDVDRFDFVPLFL
jgi:adenine deaminase